MAGNRGDRWGLLAYGQGLASVFTLIEICLGEVVQSSSPWWSELRTKGQMPLNLKLI